MDPLQSADKMPLELLPRDFKWRLIILAPVRIIRNLAKVFPEVKKLRTFRPKTYDQVFITDNEDVYQWASKETFLTVLFKLFYQYTLGKYIFDGESNVNPVWQTVLRVDAIVSRKRRIYVEDTLILHCDSIAGYEKMIRYISGPYTRLILHGNINVAQIIQLTHPGVRKVRINATIEIPVGQHTRLANFVAKHVCSDDFSFTICRYQDIRPQLTIVCKRHKRVLICDDDYISIVKNYQYLRYWFIVWPLFFVVIILYMTVTFGLTSFFTTPNTTLGFSVTCSVFISELRLFYAVLQWQYHLNRMDVNEKCVPGYYFNAFCWWLWCGIDSILLRVYKFVTR